MPKRQSSHSHPKDATTGKRRCMDKSAHKPKVSRKGIKLGKRKTKQQKGWDNFNSLVGSMKAA